MFANILHRDYLYGKQGNVLSGIHEFTTKNLITGFVLSKFDPFWNFSKNRDGRTDIAKITGYITHNSLFL